MTNRFKLVSKAKIKKKRQVEREAKKRKRPKFPWKWAKDGAGTSFKAITEMTLKDYLIEVRYASKWKVYEIEEAPCDHLVKDKSPYVDNESGALVIFVDEGELAGTSFPVCTVGVVVSSQEQLTNFVEFITGESFRFWKNKVVDISEYWTGDEIVRIGQNAPRLKLDEVKYYKQSNLTGVYGEVKLTNDRVVFFSGKTISYIDRKNDRSFVHDIDSPLPFLPEDIIGFAGHNSILALYPNRDKLIHGLDNVRKFFKYRR